MKTQCPHCEAVYNVSDENKGQAAICPKCKQGFTARQLHNESKPKPKRKPISVGGTILTIIGVLMFIMGFGAASAASTRRATASGDILNIGLLNDKTNDVILGSAAAVSGLLMIIIARINRQES